MKEQYQQHLINLAQELDKRYQKYPKSPTTISFRQTAFAYRKKARTLGK